jgi:hypothetical protein
MTAHEFVIGERSAIWQSDYGEGIVSLTTVERDTKLYWVAGGRKFRKSDGIEPRGGSAWIRSSYLLPLDDPRVVSASIAARKSAVFSKLAQAQNDLARNRESREAIEAIRSALDAYEDAL